VQTTSSATKRANSSNQGVFDKDEAVTVCQKLCADFYLQSPQEFDVNWVAYDVDPDTATWEDLHQAGFPDPYSVKEFMP